MANGQPLATAITGMLSADHHWSLAGEKPAGSPGAQGVAEQQSRWPGVRDEPVPGMLQVAASGACRQLLTSGQWHFQHGPIDLLIQLDGESSVVGQAVNEVFDEFAGLLPALTTCLPVLRQPLRQGRHNETQNETHNETQNLLSDHSMAQSVLALMMAACRDHPGLFLTPMIAVAGSIAQVICTRLNRLGINRVLVNNGGDIALHLEPGERYRLAVSSIDLSKSTAGIVANQTASEQSGLAAFEIDFNSGVRGIATSGWRGRSHSLGIADEVTVLARSASIADAAATLIANSTDVASSVIERRPAIELDPQSDLGQLLVTTNVGLLATKEVSLAINAGLTLADQMLARGLILGVRIALAGAVVARHDVARNEDPKKPPSRGSHE